MSTSELGHYVRFSQSLLSGSDAADTGVLRRAIGNANHIADQYAQNRVKWVQHSGRYYQPTGSLLSADERKLIWTSCPFDLHVREDGSSYRCRVRLRGAKVSALPGSGGLWAVLAPIGAAPTSVYAAGANVSYSALPDTAHSWRTPAPPLIYLSGGEVNQARESVSALDAVVGSPRAGAWLRAQLTIWGSGAPDGSGGFHTPLLSGVELTEYLQP